MLFLIASLIASPPALEPPPSTSAPVAAEPVPAPADELRPEFELALVRGVGINGEELRSELALRLPKLALLPHGEAASVAKSETPYLYLQGERETPTRYRIAIIVSDGRGYDNVVDVGDAVAPARVVASTIASLIASIEEGSLDPDRDDAVIPPAKPDPAAPTPAEDAEPKPEPAEAVPPPAPTTEFFVGLGTGIGTALGRPDFADAHLGFSGALELGLRSPKGFWTFAGFRPSGRSQSGYRMTRFRAAIGSGYLWRGDHLEIGAAISFAVEPWIVSTSSGLEPVQRGDVRGRPPLLSTSLRLSPGYSRRLPGGPIRGFRIGPQLALGGGFVLADGAKVGALSATDGEALFRLGGAELFTGLELALWLGPPV